MDYTTMGIEIAADRAQTWIALAGTDADRVVVELLPPVAGTDAAATVAALSDAHPIDQVAIDPRSAAATLLAPLQAAGAPLLRPETSGMAVAHGRFLDWTTAGKLRHRGHRALTDAVRQAAARRTAAGAQAVDRRVDIDPAPLIAAQLAVWALGDGEDYDVLNSIY